MPAITSGPATSRANSVARSRVDRQEATGDAVGQLDEHTTAAEQEHVAQPGPAVHAGERLGVPADHRLDRHGGIDLVTAGDRAQAR